MIVVNDKGTLAINTDKVAYFNIHSEGKKIMVNYDEISLQSMAIATYENKKQAERAFGMLINAMKEQANCFELPPKDDPRLNTNNYFEGRDSRMGLRRVGKTK